MAGIGVHQQFCQTHGMRTDVEASEAHKPGMVAVDHLTEEKRGQKRTLEGAEKMTQAKMEVRPSRIQWLHSAQSLILSSSLGAGLQDVR
jgi:hypothetical protein